MEFGKWVKVGDREGQYIHPSKEGFHTIDFDGMWEDIPTNEITLI